MTLRESLNEAIWLILQRYPADDAWSSWAREYADSTDDTFISERFAPAARAMMARLVKVRELSEAERKEAFAKDDACRGAWYLWRMGNPADDDGAAFCEFWAKEKVSSIHSFIGV